MTSRPIDSRTCADYRDGHQMHLVQYRNLLVALDRGDGEPAVVTVGEGGRVAVELADGRTLTWWHHDTHHLRDVLESGTETALVHEGLHALRVGEDHAFNCAPEDDAHRPCTPAAKGSR